MPGGHDVGEVWGGALWEIREFVGPKLADQLYLHWWYAVAAEGTHDRSLQDLGKLLIQLAKTQLDEKSLGKVSDVFDKRGLQVQ